MFENMTYENILEGMLENVPSDVDKREGSVIFDTLSPAALELANAYIYLDIVLNNAFADTAEREYLILRAKERGLTPYEATNAVLKLEVTYRGTSENVSPGDRFSLDGLTYVVTEQIVNETDEVITTYPFGDDPQYSEPGNTVYGWWKVRCETAGEEGNTRFGTATALQTISELASAKITELLIPGEDTEGTEEFRERYFEAVNNDAFGGNRADYIEKVKSIDGVGQVKVYRTPRGGGTVRVIITDSENKKPSSELISTVKEILDPEEYEGLGYGEAPIGHVVSVEGVSAVDVNVSAQWQTENNVTVSEEEVADVIENYFDEVNSTWEDKDSLTIYAAQIIARILDIEGVEDVTDVAFEGSYQKLSAGEEEIFCLNSLNGN